MKSNVKRTINQKRKITKKRQSNFSRYYDELRYELRYRSLSDGLDEKRLWDYLYTQTDCYNDVIVCYWGLKD